MRYQELYDEYSALLRRHTELRTQMHSLPIGYITKRKISGKDYYYLQHTLCGKKYSECLREERVSEIRAALDQREAITEQIEQVQTQLVRLADAAKILDAGLSRSFYFLKQCAEMDALPLSKRPKAFSFARAITALEGLPARPETEEHLHQWVDGKVLFSDFYLPALQQYNILGGQL